MPYGGLAAYLLPAVLNLPGGIQLSIPFKVRKDAEDHAYTIDELCFMWMEMMKIKSFMQWIIHSIIDTFNYCEISL